MIGKLSALLVSGNRAGFSDVGTSPRGPLDLKIQSPRCGLRCYDVGGVGLGIVAALEKSSTDCGHEILAKFAVCSNKKSISPPVDVRSGKNCDGCFQDLEIESLEDYTYVTCHGPDNKSVTRVYYDGSVTTVKESSARFVEDDVSAAYYPTSDFLSSCHLCKKKLHGKDIYMYRGEKAFCSNECRSTQIMMDERKEQCRADAPRTADVASSPYTRDHIFSTGILAI